MKDRIFEKVALSGEWCEPDKEMFFLFGGGAVLFAAASGAFALIKNFVSQPYIMEVLTAYTGAVAIGMGAMVGARIATKHLCRKIAIRESDKRIARGESLPQSSTFPLYVRCKKEKTNAR